MKITKRQLRRIIKEAIGENFSQEKRMYDAIIEILTDNAEFEGSGVDSDFLVFAVNRMHKDLKAEDIHSFLDELLEDGELSFDSRSQEWSLEFPPAKRRVREAALEEKKKKGLWANIHAKRKRGEKPAKKGDKDYPDEKAWKAAQESDCDETEDVIEEILDFIQEQDKDRMKCNSPRYIKDGETGHGDKQKVVKACEDGKEKIIRFGSAKMRNNSDKKKNKKSFRARHNCDDKKDKMKAGYWACKDW